MQVTSCSKQIYNSSLFFSAFDLEWLRYYYVNQYIV